MQAYINCCTVFKPLMLNITLNLESPKLFRRRKIIALEKQ